MAYSPNTLPPQVDAKRACDEIALVNGTTNEVTYGIDSLFKILAHRFSFLSPLFRLNVFRILIASLYSFISFNRKVIAPADVYASVCVPSFNIPYRVAYLIFSWIITSLILTNYSTHLPIPATSFGREFLICGGQILFQGAIVWFTNRNRALDYLGNMMTVSLCGGLLLLPLLWINSVMTVSSLVLFGWFAAVVTGMLFMHLHRVKLLHVSAWLTFTWIVYRVLVLIVMLLNQFL